MDEKELIHLIEKYLSHQCTEEEKIKLEEWYEAFEDKQDSFYEDNEEKINASAHRSLKAIKARLAHQTPESFSELPLKSETHRPGISSWMAAAGVAILVSVLAGIYFYAWQTPEKYTVLSANTGEVKEWKLPDGSQVWLNAGSSLKFPSNYNENNREVYLEGKAFFDVIHNPDKPFSIHSGKLTTRVLGTAFSVSAYPGAVLNTVTVMRGKVQVSNQEEVLGYLLPDNKIEYQNETNKSKIIEVDASKDIAWKEQELVFTDLPMQDIAMHLKKWFGYQFKFQNQALKDTRFTASFKNTISLTDLLEIMRQVSHVNYRINHETKTVIFL